MLNLLYNIIRLHFWEVHCMNKFNFIESIKVVPDNEKNLLLNIQDKIEKRGATADVVFSLTQNLSDIQRKKLIALYDEQIRALNFSTENYRRKIVKIKSTF